MSICICAPKGIQLHFDGHVDYIERSILYTSGGTSEYSRERSIATAFISRSFSIVIIKFATDVIYIDIKGILIPMKNEGIFVFKREIVS